MSPQNHSMSLRCRSCTSKKIEKSTDYGEFFFICHDCGCLFMPDEDEDEGIEITASVASCPHCSSADDFSVYGDQEICDFCGLDPNERDLPAHELAHLWKGRGSDVGEGERTIQETMLEGQAKFSPNSRIGLFLRNFCGPHCSLAHSCPQTTKNFSRCFREEMGPGADNMGKGRKRKNKSKKDRKRKREETSTAWVAVAGKGWYKKTKEYETKTYSGKQGKS